MDYPVIHGPITAAQSRQNLDRARYLVNEKWRSGGPVPRIRLPYTSLVISPHPYRSRWIYFVESPVLDRVKIGIAGFPKSRLEALRSASPDGELWLVAKMYGDRELEEALHGEFSADRLHGEWFNYSPDIRCLVGWLNSLADRQRIAA